MVLLVGLIWKPLKVEVPRKPPKPLRQTLAYRWSRVVQHRPWTVAIASTIALLVLAAPLVAAAARVDRIGRWFEAAMVVGEIVGQITDSVPGKVRRVLEREEVLDMLAAMLADDAARTQWGRNGLAFADSADLYSMPQHAADVIGTVFRQGEGLANLQAGRFIDTWNAHG